MKKWNLGWVALFLLTCCLTNSVAWAARPADVDAENAKVYENSNKASRVIESLRKSTTIAVSNVPTDGFHKVRTPSGKIGWMLAGDLALGPIPSPEEVSASAQRAPGSEARLQEKWIRLRVFGGLDFFTVTTPIPDFQISMGLHYGGELEHLITPSLGIILRAEQMQKGVSLTDVNTGKMFSLALGSSPVMVGVDWVFSHGTETSIRLAVLGGLGLQTVFSSTNQTDLPVNTITMVSSPFTALVRLEFLWQIFPWLGAYAEGGYRYLVSPTLITPSGGGALILNPSFSLNLSSPFVSAGVSFSI